MQKFISNFFGYSCLSLLLAIIVSLNVLCERALHLDIFLMSSFKVTIITIKYLRKTVNLYLMGKWWLLAKRTAGSEQRS